jgi:hypothetical protein
MMTCVYFGNGFICGFNPYTRFHIGNKYVWMDFHEYCGPSFWTDKYMSKPYEWKDENDIENDPVWEPFGKWLEKCQASKVRRVQRQDPQSNEK